MLEKIKLFAVTMDVKGLPNQNNDGGTSLLNDVLNLAYFVAGIVAVIVLIFAGFLYVTSAGDPGKAKNAKNAILYAVVGLVFIISAAAITAFVRSSV